jgi:hypothetical protein
MVPGPRNAGDGRCGRHNTGMAPSGRPGTVITDGGNFGVWE